MSIFFFAKKFCCFLTLDDQFPSPSRPEVPYIDKKPKFRTACLIFFPRKKPQGPRCFKRTSNKQPASFRTWRVLRPRLIYPTFSPGFFPIDLSKSGKLTSWGWGCGNIPLFTKGFLAPSKRWTTLAGVLNHQQWPKELRVFEIQKIKGTRSTWVLQILGGKSRGSWKTIRIGNNISPVNLKLWFVIWKVQLRKPYSSSRNHEKSEKRVPPMLAVFHLG